MAPDTIEQAARLAPGNVDIARTQFVLDQKLSGDSLRINLAKLNLAYLDPSADGIPVALDPGTVIIVVTVILAMTAVTVVALAPPEDRAKLAHSVYQSLAGRSSLSSAAGIGGMLLPEANK